MFKTEVEKYVEEVKSFMDECVAAYGVMDLISEMNPKEATVMVKALGLLTHSTDILVKEAEALDTINRKLDILIAQSEEKGES